MDVTKIQKLQKRKFIRNTVIVIAGLIIAAFILNLAPGYARDEFKDKVQLIINEDSITEGLVNDVYVDSEGTVYLSQKDVSNLFDSTLYYNAKYDEIIAASDTKTAIMGMNQKQMTVNGAVIQLQSPVIKIDGLIYIPISEMGLVYNIETKYVKSTNTTVIDELNKGQIVANIAGNIDLKYKPRGLSKTVTKLTEGEKVYCDYVSNGGWRQIRTENGEVGYVKESKLANQYILRQDIQPRGEAKKIDINSDSTINISNFTLNKNQSYANTWTKFVNSGFESQTNTALADINSRTKLIDTIMKLALNNNMSSINIDFTGIDNEQNFERFLIELAPRLREIGISSSAKINQGMNENDIKKIVDYIIR